MRNTSNSSWSRLARMGAAFILLIIVARGASGADEPKRALAQDAKLTAGFKVVKIRIIPTEVSFSSSREYRKILVMGKTAEAGEIDLSRQAKFAPADDCVKVDEKGFLYPVKDCQTKVAVTADSFKADLPVTIRGMGQ